MRTKEFSTVYLCDLKIDHLYSLNKSTIGFASPVRESIGELPK